MPVQPEDSRIRLARAAWAGSYQRWCVEPLFPPQQVLGADPQVAPHARADSQGLVAGIAATSGRQHIRSRGDPRHLVIRFIFVWNCPGRSRGMSVSGVLGTGPPRLSRVGADSGEPTRPAGVEPGSCSAPSIFAVHAVTDDCEFAGGRPGNHFHAASWPWAGKGDKLAKIEMIAVARTMRNRPFLDSRIRTAMTRAD